MNIFSKEMLMAAGGEKVFVRPNLTANGTMGGNAFAVYDFRQSADANNLYKAFDGNLSTYWQPRNTTPLLTFYNPDALKVTQIILHFSSSSYTGTPDILYGSDDNFSTYTTIPYTYNGGTIDCSSNTTFYKYYGIYFVGARNMRLVEVDITTTYME